MSIENLCYTLPMPIIRASEIGSYLYCRRAWRYRKSGVESENQVELAAGTELHHQHGRKTISALLLRTFGMILLLAAILLLVAFCTAQL
jgi:CRISPR/Cas system-associated exonuclease Cas4 (RecB family)